MFFVFRRPEQAGGLTRHSFLLSLRQLYRNAVTVVTPVTNPAFSMAYLLTDPCYSLKPCNKSNKISILAHFCVKIGRAIGMFSYMRPSPVWPPSETGAQRAPPLRHVGGGTRSDIGNDIKNLP